MIRDELREALEATASAANDDWWRAAFTGGQDAGVVLPVHFVEAVWPLVADALAAEREAGRQEEREQYAQACLAARGSASL